MLYFRLFPQVNPMATQLPRERLERAVARYEELITLLGTPEVASNADRLRKIGQEQSVLEPLVEGWRSYLALELELNEARELLAGSADEEMRALAEAEIEELEPQQQELEADITERLIPRDPNDDRDVIVEIRAGAGGDEAALFAAELHRMYVRYAEGARWKVDVMNSSHIGIGGLKEIIFSVKGKGAYSKLKWESGVHRVQRVPQTETSGRIHTSTATVAVLPEVDEVEVNVPESDIRVDVFRSSGPGGQSVNTTDSAVRLTHIPTGLVISCQDEKSQLQNRRKALQVLRAKLHQLESERQMNERGDARRSMVGSGDRSEKIRTYNFSQSRITDHRIGFSTFRLNEVLAGDITELIEELRLAERAERLARAQADGADGSSSAG